MDHRDAWKTAVGLSAVLTALAWTAASQSTNETLGLLLFALGVVPGVSATLGSFVDHPWIGAAIGAALGLLLLPVLFGLRDAGNV